MACTAVTEDLPNDEGARHRSDAMMRSAAARASEDVRGKGSAEARPGAAAEVLRFSGGRSSARGRETDAPRASPHVPPADRVSNPNMLTALLIASPLLVAAPLPQTPSIQTVLQFGDTLTNGDTVLGILSSTVADTGSWAALVNTSGGRAVVRDGQLLLSTGGTYLGDPVTGIFQAQLSRDGTFGVLYQTPGSGSSDDFRLRIGPDVILQTGDPISFGFAGLSGTVRALAGFDFEGDSLAVAMVTNSLFLTTERSLLVGSIAGGGFTPTLGWKNGGAIPGLSADFDRWETSFSAAPSGRFASTVQLESSGSPAFGVVIDGSGIAETGGAGPFPNSVWNFVSPPQVDVAAGGDYIVSGTVGPSLGVARGAIFVGTTSLALQGGAVNGVAGDFVGPFEVAEVEITDSGTPIFILPFQSGRDRLLVGSEVIIETGTPAVPGTLSSGEVITSLATASGGGRLATTSDGSTLLAVGSTPSGNSLFLVERTIGDPVDCSAVSNSTGAVGSLGADGSSFVSMNDLRLDAAGLPFGQFTLLLTSRNQQFVPNPGGSQGNLCLGPGIGRLNSQVQPVGSSGQVTFDMDLTAIPTPNALVAGAPGETWLFQVWHRDVVGGAQTSNYTRATAVTLR